ncbi:MAG: TetR/AcrR family transcriptional regulator [Mycobacteriaceae bacterium]
MQSPRERLIEATVALMSEGGVSGTGISEILQLSGTARRSVYQNFPAGKTQLVAEAARSAGDRASALFAVFTDNSNPLESLTTFADVWRAGLTHSNFAAGCPIVAAALAGKAAPEATAVAADIFRDWEHLLIKQLLGVGIAEHTALSLATTVVCAIEGAVIMAIAKKSVVPVDRVEKSLKELLTIHTTVVG